MYFHYSKRFQNNIRFIYLYLSFFCYNQFRYNLINLTSHNTNLTYEQFNNITYKNFCTILFGNIHISSKVSECVFYVYFIIYYKYYKVYIYDKTLIFFFMEPLCKFKNIILKNIILNLQ